MYLQTMLELSHMTDNIRFEWMMCDLLSSYKYKGLDPQSPGMKDNGKDALYYDATDAVVFAFSIEKKKRTGNRSSIKTLRARKAIISISPPLFSVVPNEYQLLSGIRSKKN